MVCRETPVPECVRARLCDICELEATLYDKVVERRRKDAATGGDSRRRKGLGRRLGPGWNGGEVGARWWSDGVESGDVIQVGVVESE